jgi:hypothetical protein
MVAVNKVTAVTVGWMQKRQDYISREECFGVFRNF